MSSESIRLNKLIALHLGVGRRQADFLIEQGRVTLNDSVATLGDRAAPVDVVAIDGKVLRLKNQPDLIYILLHKPVGYVCSRRQQGDTPTIYALLPKKYHHLQPVGRLDKDSSGLLLLTNDGDFALRMTHPRFAKIKEYEVQLDLPLQPIHRQVISDHGIELPDGNSKLQLEQLHEGNEYAWRVLMHEGRNRQIRRTFEALGYKVLKLHRVVFGAYELGTLRSGEWKEVAATR